MTPADFALGCLLCLALLSVLAAIGDWWDGRARRDARNRNHARRIR